MFGGSKLQASGLQKGPLATAKQHLIACRNRAQTYPQKLPNAPSEFLEKISLFLFPAAVVWWLQAASIRLPEGTLSSSSSSGSGSGSGRGRGRGSSSSSSSGSSGSGSGSGRGSGSGCGSGGRSSSIVVVVVAVAAVASIRLAEGTPRHSKTAPNCVPKPCSNLPTKTA